MSSIFKTQGKHQDLEQGLEQSLLAGLSSPVAILDDNSELQLSFTLDTARVHGQRVHTLRVQHDNPATISIRRIKLFEIDLQCKDLSVFAGGFYMPSDASGFYRLSAGEPAPKGTAWKAQDATDHDFICHTMAAMHEPGRDTRQHLIGFTTFNQWHSYLLFHTQGESIKCTAWCDLHHANLAPNTPLTLESFIVNTASSHLALLDHYADHLATLYKPRVAPGTLTGWIDWQYYREEKTAADVFRTVDALKKLRKQGFDHQYIIIDGGWCNFASEWLSPCDKFPEGMKAIAKRLHDDGFKFGLWFAPYLTNVQTKVAIEHPEWMAKHRETGELLFKERSNVGPCNILDFSIPEAQDWLRNVVSTMVNEWGIDFLKLDGPCLAHYKNARFAHPDSTPVKQVRDSLQIIRKACGEKVIIEGEGIYGPSIGMVDIQRTTQDSSTHWYSETGAPYAKTNMKDDLASAWMHRKFWHNHRENIITRDFCSPFHAGKIKHPESRDAVLTQNQMQFQLTATTLAGGAQLLSDPAEELIRNPQIIARLAQLQPHVQTVACMPIDIAQGHTPSFYHQPVTRADQQGHVLAVFNWTDQYQDYQVPLQFAGSGEWHVHEFWQNTYLGRCDQSLQVLNVPAHGCRLFALTPAQNHPQLVGSDVHLFQGAAELQSMHWHNDTLELKIRHFHQVDRVLTFTNSDADSKQYQLLDVQTNATSHLVDSRQQGLIRIHYSGPCETAFKLIWKAL